MEKERVIEAVTEVFGVTRDQMLSEEKKRNVVYARATATMYLRIAGLTLRETGILVGRDHASISRYENQLIEVIIRDDEYKRKYELVGKILNDRI